jgi:hypothetical protein
MEGINRWESIRGMPDGNHGINKEGFVEKAGLVSKETI